MVKSVRYVNCSCDSYFWKACLAMVSHCASNLPTPPVTTTCLVSGSKRSAAFIGGGSGLGMLIGGLASGGTGLLIGGLAGGGAGTAAAGLTGNRDIDIPAESVVHFKLASDLVVQEGQ